MYVKLDQYLNVCQKNKNTQLFFFILQTVMILFQSTSRLRYMYIAWPAVWVFYHLTKVDISIENIDFNKNAAISI